MRGLRIGNASKTGNAFAVSLVACASMVSSVVSPLCCAGTREVAADCKSFKNRIANIQKEVVDLTDQGALLDSALFMEIWRHPQKYFEDVRLLLGDSRASEMQKEIAVLSMQSLPLNAFTKFCTAVLFLKDAGKVTDETVCLTIFPGYDWNTKLQENFQNIDVRKFLFTLRDSIPGRVRCGGGYDRKYIDEILSG